MTGLVWRHPGLCAVLALAALLRLAVWIAYRPILFFADSIDYVNMASKGSPVTFAPTPHPSGYAVVVEVLSGGFKSLAALSAFQHLAGLGAGALVYALLLRLGTPMKVAVLAAALALLDLWLIALEQHLASETIFLTVTIASAYLAVVHPSVRGIAASGTLLGLAATIRPAAVFAVPVWVVYVLWARLGRKAFASGVVAVTLPLLGYSLAHDAARGWFGLSEADGWILYGRTAEFADCRGVKPPAPTRSLCLGARGERLPSPVDYVFTPRSPAWETFGPVTSGRPEERRRVNGLLRDFALAAIRDHPGVYLREVAAGTGRLFLPDPGNHPPSELPDETWRPEVNADLEREYFPGYSVPRPSGILLSLQRVLHTPTWLMALLAVASALSLLCAIGQRLRGREPPPHRRETALCSGMALAVLVGSVATSNSDPRFLLTGVPLLICGGVLATQDLIALLRRSSAGSESGASRMASPST